MPKQIKLTDSVAAELERRAREDNLTLAGEVNKLLTDGGSDLSGILDHLDGYLDKKFEHLEKLFTDNLVDVVAAGSGRAPGEKQGGKQGGKEWVKWEQMQYIIFNREDDDPAWVIPEGAVFSFKNGDPNELAYYIKDGTIYIDGPQPVAILKVTPDIREAIDKHFTFND